MSEPIPTNRAVPGPAEHQRGGWRRELGAVAVLLLFGLVLATMPHWLGSRQGQDLGWVASHDELGCYLPVASQAYHNHPLRLTDPVLAEGGDCIYPVLQLLPGVWLAKLFGLGPFGITLGWRLCAGLTLPLGFYLLLRRSTARPFIAAALTALLLCDYGLVHSRLVDHHFLIFFRLLGAPETDPIFGGWPQLLHQWRLITPSLSLVFLLLHLWLLLRAQEQPTRLRLAWSGIAFGLLFWVYFYYWTAAGAALALGWLFVPELRRVCLHTGWVGGLIGLPSLVQSALIKQAAVPGWMQNVDMFLPIPRLSDLSLPPVAIALTIIALAWCGWRQRHLLPVALLAFCGLLLKNHQLFTGLQIQNGHWSYVWGPLLALTLLLIAAEEGARRRSPPPWLTGLAVLALAAHIGVGLTLRYWEVTRSREPVALNGLWGRYSAQRGETAAAPLAPNTVVAGDHDFANFALIQENVRVLLGAAFLSPAVDMAELDERTALNDRLLGLSTVESQARFQRWLAEDTSGPWARSDKGRARREAHGLAIYRSVAAHLGSALRRYGVRYVALPAAQAPPAYLAEGWQRLQAGPHWQLWERTSAAR